MPRALVLSHDWIAHELGHLGPWFERHGFDVTRIYREQQRALPEADLLVVMGSPGSVAGPTCPEPAASEVALVRDWIEQDRPYLGICYGAQVLARATGGHVHRMPVPFSGYVPIELDAAAPEALGGPWMIAHNDAIAASTGTSRLASLDHADLALRSHRAWGIQPHVEGTPETLERMFVALDFTPSLYEPIVEAVRSDATNAARAQALLDAFLADVA